MSNILPLKSQYSLYEQLIIHKRTYTTRYGLSSNSVGRLADRIAGPKTLFRRFHRFFVSGDAGFFLIVGLLPELGEGGSH